MADYTNVQKSSSAGWIIGAIAVAAVLLFLIVSAGNTPAPIDSGTASDAVAPSAETTAPAAEPAVPAGTVSE
ncbi:hypothetical protein ACXYMO_03570 [Arenibacterium sp. CAU 1754]